MNPLLICDYSERQECWGAKKLKAICSSAEENFAYVNLHFCGFIIEAHELTTL